MKSSSLAAEGAAAKDRNPVREDLVSFGVPVKYDGVLDLSPWALEYHCVEQRGYHAKNGSCQNHCIVCTALQVLHMFTELMRHNY